MSKTSQLFKVMFWCWGLFFLFCFKKKFSLNLPFCNVRLFHLVLFLRAKTGLFFSYLQQLLDANMSSSCYLFCLLYSFHLFNFSLEVNEAKRTWFGVWEVLTYSSRCYMLRNIYTRMDCFRDIINKIHQWHSLENRILRLCTL